MAALLNHHAVEGGRVGTVGFCMGGHLALLAGCRNARVGAVVDFYGALPGVDLELDGLEAPVLAIFAGQDESISAEQVAELRQRLEAAGKKVSFRIRPGVGHAFMNDSRPDRHDATAAAEAWDRMLAFLRAELS